MYNSQTKHRNLVDHYLKIKYFFGCAYIRHEITAITYNNIMNCKSVVSTRKSSHTYICICTYLHICIS